MNTPLSSLLAPMLSSAAMRAICDDVAALQNMLDFEAALARAEAAAGVIPESATGSIGKACKADAFDIADFAEMNAAWEAWVDPANTPARIMLVDQLATRLHTNCRSMARQSARPCWSS